MFSAIGPIFGFARIFRLGDKSLEQQYQYLCNTVRWKNGSIASVFSSAPLNKEFRRALTGNKWDFFVTFCANTHLSSFNRRPEFFRVETHYFRYLYCYVYVFMLNGNMVFLRKYI